MTSRFGWVDFAEQDRQKMLDVVRLFKEKETRDELGIGTIRDAFADYFFPGTTTIQTRARYMLFVPWIYRRLEKKKVQSDKFAARARSDEIKLIYALLAGGETEGVIGSRAKANLKRFPSNIYWLGLGSWGIRQFQGSQAQYHRHINNFYLQMKYRLENDDNEVVGSTSGQNWDPGLPPCPKGLFEKSELALNQEEAHYLQDRIRYCHPDTLLAFLVTESHFVETDFIWEHPVVQRLPDRLKQDITHAQNFSETVYGAALLYNLLLAQKRDHQELMDEHQDRFNQWADSVDNRWAELITWHNNSAAFWSSPALRSARIPLLTRSFVKEWWALIFGDRNNLAGLTDRDDAQHLIQSRERQLKRAQARLENARALERWEGHSGDYQLDYRWRIAQTFAADILAGLDREED
jgi:hypothetical protein